MRSLYILIILAAMSSGCIRMPELTLPDDATMFALDIGDTAAALEGVKAYSKKYGDLTSQIIIDGIECVGKRQLGYVVYDADRYSDKKTRNVIIKNTKLLGAYCVISIANDPAKTEKFYDIILQEDPSDADKIIANNWDQQPEPTILLADGTHKIQLYKNENDRKITRLPLIEINYKRDNDGRYSFTDGIYRKEDSTVVRMVFLRKD